MREFFSCDQECDVGYCPSACGPKAFCYYSTPDASQAYVSKSLEKQSLIIHSKKIDASESKCLKPGIIFCNRITKTVSYIIGGGLANSIATFKHLTTVKISIKLMMRRSRGLMGSLTVKPFVIVPVVVHVRQFVGIVDIVVNDLNQAIPMVEAVRT